MASDRARLDDLVLLADRALPLIARVYAAIARTLAKLSVVALVAAVAVWILQDRTWPGDADASPLGGVILAVVLLAPSLALLWLWAGFRRSADIDSAQVRADLGAMRGRASAALAGIAEVSDSRGPGVVRAARLARRGRALREELSLDTTPSLRALLGPLRPLTLPALWIGIAGTVLLIIVGIPVALLA